MAVRGEDEAIVPAEDGADRVRSWAEESAADGRRRTSAGFRAALGALAVRSVRTLADFVVPPACLVCRGPLADYDAVCCDCWREIDFIAPPLCDRLGLPMPFDTGDTMISAAAAADPPVYDRARAVARFDATLRRLVHDLKFHDRHEAVGMLGRLMAHAGAELLDDAEVVVPVPLDRWRLLSRRFNQAGLLARELSRLTRREYVPDARVRVRRTRPQVELTREQRVTNVAGAFRVPAGRSGKIDGRAVLLIDDVITTGATADACARVLKRAGAKRVDVLALGLVADRARATT